MFKTYLVTGGAGFIGSNLVDYLLEKNCNVIVVDDLSTGKISNLSKAKNHCSIIESKIENLEWDMIGKINGVVHLAAQTSVPASIKDFKKSSSLNILGSISVINFCRLSKIPLIYASSSAVYGELKIGDDNSDDVDLISPYAVDKYSMEKYAEVANRVYGLASIGLRIFNVYGPRQDSKSPYSGVISKFIDSIINLNPIYINGGYQTRDFIYVDDIVRFIYKSLVLASEKSICDKINLLTGKSISINKLADILIEISGANAERIYKQLTEGDPTKSDGTVEKMQHIFDIKMSDLISIKTGIKSTIEYFKSDGKL